MRFPQLARIVERAIAALAVVAPTQSVLASPPSDLVPLGPSLPSCNVGAPDTRGVHICWVTPLRPGWQASTGEWIVVRLGDAEAVDPANPDTARTLCEELQASILATITLDRESLPVDSTTRE